MRSVMHRCIAFALVALPLAFVAPASAMTADQASSDVRAFIEWVLKIKVDPALAQSMDKGIAEDMASNPSATMATVNDMNNVMAYVHSHSKQDDAVLRTLIEPQLIVFWQNDTVNSNNTSSMLVAAWEKRNHIIANGKPPLRSIVVNDYIALYEFLAKEMGKPVPAAVADHAKFRQQVAAQYAAATPAQQLAFNQYQTMWYIVHDKWKAMTPAQQAAFRQSLRNANTRPVAARPPPPSNFSGQVTEEERMKEDQFVTEQGESMMMGWTNPTAM